MSVSDELLDRFLDGDVSREEHRQILSWLETGPDHIQLLAQRAELHADLRRSLKRRGIQNEALNSVHHTHGLDARDHECDSRRHSRLQTTLTYSLIAAALATAASLAVMFLRPGMPSSPAAIAQVAFQSNALWATHREEGASIGVETLRLEAGLARLDFANGASVTLQGPAVFEVISGEQARLHNGIMTAHVPKSGVGFRVETPALQVIDLGTAFGVSVSDDGLTNVSVFEGEVEVNLQADSLRHVPAQRVVEGQAIRAARTSPTIESVEFEIERFERAWPINSGVLQTTGVMKFVAPGPGFVPGRYEDSEHIVVFPERRGVLLESSIRIDIAEPGEYRRLRDKPAHSLATGNRVRSYLLQLNPVGRNRAVAMGQITFDKPILGLLASTGKLAESDGTLGHPEGVYEQNRRGIEPPRKDPPEKPDRDTVILAADKRTLVLNLGAGSALDQIRVIVDDPDPTWSDQPR